MQMRLIRGKNIVSAGYDPVTGTLRTRFGKSGEYDYSGVPEDKFVSLCRVPFPDSYYHKAIKGKFPCVKVVDPPEEPNGTGAKIQDTSGRDSDRSVEVSAGTACEQFRGTNSGTNVQDGVRMGRRDAQSAGRDAQSAGGRVVEIFGPQDGVTFVEEGHVYYLKGQRIPFSLTQILELSGLSRQPTEPSEIAARPAAAIRGTRVHEYTLWEPRAWLAAVPRRFQVPARPDRVRSSCCRPGQWDALRDEAGRLRNHRRRGEHRTGYRREEMHRERGIFTRPPNGGPSDPIQGEGGRIEALSSPIRGVPVR